MQASDLKSIPPFSHLPADFLELLQSNARTLTAAPGEVLCYEGDPADTLYLLLEGQVALIWAEQWRGVLHPGTVIDPAAVFGGLPHTVRATASTECRLLCREIDQGWQREDVQIVLQQHLGALLADTQARLSTVTQPVHYLDHAAAAPGPYRFKDSTIIFAFCEADLTPVEAALPEDLSLLRVPGKQRAPVFIAFADFPHAHPEADPAARFAYTETTYFIPVRHKTTPGVFIPSIYPSSWEPIVVGREVYGFPKQLGFTRLGTKLASLEIDDRPALSLTWNGQEASGEAQLVGALMAWLGLERHTATAAFQVGEVMRKAAGFPGHRRVDVFNRKRIPSPASTAEAPAYSLDQLTHAVFGVLQWFQVARLLDPALAVQSGPFAQANLTLREAFRTQLDMRLSTGEIIHEYKDLS